MAASTMAANLITGVVMGIKKSVMISDESEAFIRGRTRDADGEPSWSAAINGTIEAHRALLRNLVPELDAGAWTLLLNAHNAHFFDWRTPQPLRLASDIMDDLGVISVDDLVPDVAAHIRAIHALTQPQQAAVFEVIRIFWANDWSGEGGGISAIIAHIISSKI